MNPEHVVTLTGLTRFFPMINASLLCGLLALVIKYRLDNRKLSITENTGLRKEFIEEMHALREEVRGLRTENGQLRDEVRQLHGIIDGMSRQATGDAISIQRAIVEALPAGQVSKTIIDAAKRADEARSK